MNLLQRTERLVKQNWKERKRITLAVIVSFLINGGVGYATEDVVRGDNVSNTGEPSQVDIKPKDDTIKVKTDTTGTIVDINRPDNNGVSHNTYDTFNMNGKDSKVLFNNSAKEGGEGERGGSSLGFKNVHRNENFTGTNSATLIISEITGDTSTQLQGNLEVRNDDDSKTTDLIFANENGINVNGIKYFGVGSVMYVNNRDWANQTEFNKQKNKMETEPNYWGKDGYLFSGFGGETGLGAIHKGKKSDTSDPSWSLSNEGISKNTEKLEKRKLEKEKRRLEEERERLERERLERERLERERLERERLERERLERERLERERLERERLERERLERERLERERLERERLERERLERERLERERLERERLEREKEGREKQEEFRKTKRRRKKKTRRIRKTKRRRKKKTRRI
ncbi:hypothetical protein FNF_05405 [Fusobacterium necrophorum subsp. funduliforme B35]|uniref:two-partner secretion domain-containing protein n=1 Tax=Fusobacterium necrophorum TaxID=859 RepID=UPI0004313982|nr:hypothetical protein [Fusobacterium necrophorum]EYD69159.1 hypothetical protein FNF_05405 [Fusobacterium necrophorum subsp. funduliforme B35]